MSEDDLEFPPAPLSPSLPSDFLDPNSAFEEESQKSNERTKTPYSSPQKMSTSPQRSITKSPSKSSINLNSTNAGISKSHTGAKPERKLDQPDGKSDRAPSAHDEKRIVQLKAQMGQWIQKARVKKHESDKANSDRSHVFSILLAIDSVVCFMIAFDLEDRADAIRAGSPELGKPLHARSWSTLIPFLVKIASKAESVDADLAGVCYAVSAVVSLHVAYLQRRTAPPETHTRDLYRSLADFRRASHLLPNSVIRTRYSMDYRTGWEQAKIDPNQPDPVNNRACSPLHVNSSLAEAAAFALNLARLWTLHEGVRYTWEAANPVS